MYKLIRNQSHSIRHFQGLLSIDCHAKTKLKQKNSNGSREILNLQQGPKLWLPTEQSKIGAIRTDKS